MIGVQSDQDLMRVHIFVTGQVQGVGYRSTTWNTAVQFNLNGWVRNLSDGRVEAVFEGSQDNIEHIIHWCHSGPPAAVVQEVRVKYEPPEGLLGFQVTH